MSTTINIPVNVPQGFDVSQLVAQVVSYASRFVTVTGPAALTEEKLAAIDHIDHALGQLRQMQEGKLEGVDAEALLNEL